MEKARDAAGLLPRAVPLTREPRDKAIEEKDKVIAAFSTVIMNPGLKLSIVLTIIRLVSGERCAAIGY